MLATEFLVIHKQIYPYW